MVEYQLSTSIDFSTYLDLTGVVDTRRTSIQMNGCSTSFTSSQDTASFTIRNIESTLRSSAITMLLNAYENGNNVYGRIKDGANYLFTGMVDLGGISLKSTSIAGELAIELIDFGKLYLDVAPKRNIVLESVTISSVVNTLLGYTGCAIGTISIDSGDDATLPCFVVDKDEGTAYREYIDKLLLEAGLYYLYFDENGRANTAKVTLSASSGPAPNYLIRSGIETSGSQTLESKGLKVQWSTAATRENQIIYVDNISKSLTDDGYSVIGTEIQDGNYYPADGDIDPIYQEYSVDFLDRAYMSGSSRKKNKDLSLLMAKDVSMTVQFTNEDGNSLATADCITYPSSPFTEEPTNPIYYAKKAFVLMQAIRDCYILHFQLKGTVRYRDVSYISSIGNTTAEPIEYTSEYIFDKTHAEEFTERYWQMKQMCRLVHKWSDIDALAIGTVVKIEHKATAVSQYAYIVARTTTYSGSVWIYQYTAVSIGSWTQQTVNTSGTSLENGGLSSVTVQYAWNQSNISYPENGWTAKPTSKPADGYYQWMRTSTDDGITWYYSCITGEQGKSSSVEYALGSDPNNPPAAGAFSESVPALRDGYYIWMRTRVGDGVWQYIRLTGEQGADAIVFDFNFDVSAFKQDRRQAGCQTIQIVEDMQGISVTPAWVIMIDGVDVTSDASIWDSANLTVTIPYINSYSEIEVTMSHGAYTAVHKLSAIDETGDAIYCGELTALPTGQIYIVGDYFVASEDFTGTDGKSYKAGYPYYYDGTSWNHELDIADSNNMNKALDVFGGILNAGIAVDANSPIWTWLKNLVVQNAVSANLTTRNITVGDGDGTSGSGFRFRAHSYDSNGGELTTPIFDVYYGDTLVFQIDASTGNVTMVNASITGDFVSTGFATSKSSSSTSTFSFSYADLDERYDAKAWSHYVRYKLPRVSIDTSTTLSSSMASTLVSLGADSDYTYSGRPYSSLIVSGTFKGESFTSISYIGDFEKPAESNQGIVVNGVLWLCPTNMWDGFTDISTSEYPSSVTIDGSTISWTDSRIYIGYYLGTDDLEWLISTYSIPTGTELKVASGTISINGTTLTASNIYLNITSSVLSIIDDDNSTTYSFTTDTGYSAGAFVLSNVTIETSFDGIKTMNIIPYEDSTYDIGSSTKSYANIYGTVQSSSSRAKKTEIEDYADKALDIINGTKIVSFKYKADLNRERCYRHYGFIADDTAEELATPYHDVMDYGNCIGILMKAVQELSDEIKKLKGE